MGRNRSIPLSICPGFLIALLVCMPVDAQAQARAFGESFPVGSLAAVGNVDAIRAGQATAIMNNPAHVAWGSRWSVSGGYRRLYELEYLQRTWGAMKYRHGVWGIGLAVTRLGKEDFYTETEAAVCLGLRIKKVVAIGVSLHNQRLAYTPQMPTYSGWSMGLGSIIKPLSMVLVSGSISHALAERFIPGHDLPRQYRLSAAAYLPGHISLGVGWQKNEGDRDILGFGQKIQVADNFAFLSAVYFDPARYALGGEFILGRQSIYYCYLSHPELGGTHYIEFEIGGRQ